MVLSTGYNKTRTAVFISGTGSNLKSLIKFSRTTKSPISIDFIVSNNSKAKGLNYAKIYKIKKKVFSFKNKNISENINNWIIAEFLIVKDSIQKHIKEYRFDEAAKNVYQFVWYSFCDWYLELSKTIYNSDNQHSKVETRNVSAYVFKEILILLHPFIPFITEEVWLKNKLDKNNEDYLMFANWSKIGRAHV